MPRSAHATDEPLRAPTDEIDLVAYARTCWRYRYLLIAVALLVGISTYAINRRMAPTYEVAFRLMVTQLRMGDEPAREVNIVPFRELVESPMLVAALLDEFSLRGEPHNLTPQRFLTGHVNVSVIRDSSIIRVAVRLKDRELVLKVANRYAERVVDLAQRLNTEDMDYTTERIRRERDATLQRLTTTEQSLEDYRRRIQIELVRNDVDAMLLRRPEALDLTVEIQGERARVQQVEADLARQERIRGVRRAVDSVPATASDASGRQRSMTPTGPNRAGAQSPSRPAPADAASETLDIRSELLDPYVNPVYDALARDLATARSRLASLEQRRRELVNRLQLDAPSAQKLNRLYEAETGLAKLSRENDVARGAYLAAANKYEEARLQSTMRAPRLQILDTALPPDRPVAPRAVRNTLTVMLIVLTIVTIAVLAYDGSRQRTL